MSSCLHASLACAWSSWLRIAFTRRTFLYSWRPLLQPANGIYPFDLAYFCPHRHDINVLFNSFIRLVPILQNDKLAGHLFHNYCGLLSANGHNRSLAFLYLQQFAYLSPFVLALSPLGVIADRSLPHRLQNIRLDLL